MLLRREKQLVCVFIRSDVWCFYVNVVELKTQQCDHDALALAKIANPLWYSLFNFVCN